MVPFAGWELPVQYEGVIAEHKAVRSDSGVFDVSHMGEIEVEGPTAAALLQSLLSNDVSRLEIGEAQYTLLTNETGGIIDDLIVYRTDVCRFLLVVNAANAEADFDWIKAARDSRLRCARRLRRVRAARRSGPARDRAARARARRRVHLGDGLDRRDRGDDQPHRLHRRGGRRARLPARGRARALERDPGARRHAVRARSARHAAARGLLPAARQRHRPPMGRDLERPRLGLRARDGVHGRRAAARDQGCRPRAAARRVPDDRAGDPEAGHGDRRRRRGHLRLALADARGRDRPRLRSVGHERARHRAGRRRARPLPHAARWRRNPSTGERSDQRWPRCTPTICCTTSDHDWARIEGDEAVLGVTWFAVDSLGELVHYEPPAPGASVSKGSLLRRGRVGEGRLGPDLAALGRGARGERRPSSTRPRPSTRIPYGQGWLIRIRLTDPDEAGTLLDAAAYREIAK